jgi:hypothetical protein
MNNHSDGSLFIWRGNFMILIKNRMNMIRFWGVILLFSACISIALFPTYVRAADELTYNDGVDDFYLYYPTELEPERCVGPTGGYSGYDVKEISILKDVNGLHCNITFNGIVTVDNLYLMLFFDINGTYSDINDVPPYTSKDNFFIDIGTLGVNRFCFTYEHQHNVDPIVHNEYTIEMLLPAFRLPWIESTPNVLPVDEWNIYGYSRINMTGEFQGWDYINWPWRFSNDQLRYRSRNPWYNAWTYVLIVGAIVAVGLVTIFVLKKKGNILKNRTEETAPKTTTNRK